MSDLQNQTPADTYKGLLQVGDYTNGVDANSEYVQDGEGTNSALSISTTKVGVGTVSPSAELDVNGNVVADEYALDQIGSSSSAVAIHAPDTNELAIRTNSTEAMRIDSAGRVGIGTTSPDAKLDLQTSDHPFYIRSGAGANDNLFIFENPTAGPQLRMYEKGTSNVAVKLSTHDDSYFNGGNVGIGITSPVTKLDINEVAGTNDVIQTFSKGGVGQARVGLCGATSQVLDGALADDLCIRSDGHNIRFGTASATRSDMTIDTDGNVGVGVTSFGTNASGVIGIGNATAPTSSPDDMVQLYAEDVTASSELRVRDQAGNVTTLSPHAKDAPDSLYDNGKGVDEMHRVANHYLGTITFTNVDRRNDLMQKQLNGEELPEDRTFKVTETFAEYNARTGADLQVEDWDANQQAMFDAQEEKVVARQAEIDAWDNEEEEAPEPLQSYVKKPKPDWLT